MIRVGSACSSWRAPFAVPFRVAPCPHPAAARAGPVGRPWPSTEVGRGQGDRSGMRCRWRGFDGIPDGITVCCQPGHELLKAVDGCRELIVVARQVFSTAPKLSMTCSTVWLLSAKVCENDEVLDMTESSTAPLSCSTCNSEDVSAFRSAGLRPRRTGFKPPKSKSRSSAGAVRSTGICEPAGRCGWIRLR